MANDTVTLAINGIVPLDAFAGAITGFQALMRALSEDMGVEGEIEWYIHDLHISSAIATVRGEAKSPEPIERVVRAYTRVGRALETSQPIPFSEKVKRSTEAITKVINEKVVSVRFETADVDATVYNPLSKAPRPELRISQGAVEGRVQTLSNRKGLRFTLFDMLNDKAVSCYLQEGAEEKLREAWDKRAIVEGTVSRELFSGRPISVRQVTNIRILSETEPGGYLKARGISPIRSGDPLPEQTIRRMRDA